MQENEKLEDISMLIIANSGAARAGVFEALAEAKGGNFLKADELLEKADEFFLLAHKAHRELLKMDSKGEVEQLTVLLTHAQDHLMNSVLAQELIKEIIILHKRINESGR